MCIGHVCVHVITKKAPWHMSVYGQYTCGIVRAVLNSTVSLKHKRYRHVSSWWRRNVRVRRASYKVRVRCNIVRPNTAVQRGNPWLIQGAYDIRPHGVGSSSSNALKNIEEPKNETQKPIGKEKIMSFNWGCLATCNRYIEADWCWSLIRRLSEDNTGEYWGQLYV